MFTSTTPIRIHCVMRETAGSVLAVTHVRFWLTLHLNLLLLEGWHNTISLSNFKRELPLQSFAGDCL
jgi:hypothetical protein